MQYLAIDPGNDTGWAEFNNEILVKCGLGRPPTVSSVEGKTFSKVVAERPKVYPSRSSKADPQSIITLAIGLGRHLERYPTSEMYLVLPSEWKGEVPKSIHNARILKTFRTYELYILDQAQCTEKKRHNVIDAIGLGKWFWTNMRWLRSSPLPGC